jgi:hypothetical protein
MDLSDRALHRLPPATKPQIEHIERLVNDVGFADRKARNAWLSEEVGRPIVYIDDLKKVEAIEIIRTLLQWRDRKLEQ